jgi:hypothetical protein
MKKRHGALAGLAFCSLFLLALACDDGRTPSEPRGAVRFETILKRILPDVPPSGLQEHAVIRDRASWEEVWKGLHRNDPPPLPEIDFRREMVVLAIGPGCCGDVEIRSIVRDRDELVVKALARTSGAQCFATDFSVHAVRLLRSEAPARFEVAAGTKSCSAG